MNMIKVLIIKNSVYAIMNLPKLESPMNFFDSFCYLILCDIFEMDI